MKLLILGAGGIGGYFGGRLVEAGADVTFLVRPKRREQLVRDGLRIESPLGALQRPVQTVLAADLQPRFDVVLLTCKAYDFDSAVEAVAPAMQGSCAILPLLNGIAHFDRLDQRFGRGNVLGGTCAINVTLRKDGVVHHQDALQRLVFGERDRARSARAQALADVLAKTTVDWEWADDVEQSVWEKIVFLSALAATTCLFRANIGEIVAAPGGRETIERVLAANVAVATREGHPPRVSAIELARAGLTNPAGTWSSSMLRDLESGGPVESDHIVGWMLDKTRQHSLDDTILALAYTHLKAYETRRTGGRLPGAETIAG